MNPKTHWEFEANMGMNQMVGEHYYTSEKQLRIQLPNTSVSLSDSSRVRNVLSLAAIILWSSVLTRYETPLSIASLSKPGNQ